MEVASAGPGGRAAELSPPRPVALRKSSQPRLKSASPRLEGAATCSTSATASYRAPRRSRCVPSSMLRRPRHYPERGSYPPASPQIRLRRQKSRGVTLALGGNCVTRCEQLQRREQAPPACYDSHPCVALSPFDKKLSDERSRYIVHFYRRHTGVGAALGYLIGGRVHARPAPHKIPTNGRRNPSPRLRGS